MKLKNNKTQLISHFLTQVCQELLTRILEGSDQTKITELHKYLAHSTSVGKKQQNSITQNSCKGYMTKLRLHTEQPE